MTDQPARPTRPAGALLAQAVQRLAAAGVAGAEGDARLLLAHALGLPRHRLRDALDAPLPAPAAAWFDAAVQARAARRPVSQIVGFRDFWNHRFRVTADTLDPRPETETVVAEALRLPWRSVLDLGTGTGAILLSLLAERPGTSGLGVDRSQAALDVARANAGDLGIAAELALSDWFSGVRGRFDLIVSNPPYIAADEMPGLSPEVRLHEPRIALTDDGDGLGAYRVIAAGAAAHLTPGGWLAVEIGPTQAAPVAALVSAGGLAPARVVRDLDGRDRVVLAQAPPAPAGE